MGAKDTKINILDEQTPLLADTSIAKLSNEATAPINPDKAGWEDDDTPLPMAQIVLLCYARMIEPVAFFGIFPFINKMVADNGHIAEANVGFYSGLIESLFSLTQMFVMIFWGRMADKFGRKPVLVISLLGVAFTTALFGFAHTIWQMILFRCLAGVFAGSIVTIRTMITELSTSKTQAQSFSYFAFAGNVGIFLGPLIGGFLADVSTQYPRYFSHVRFFELYPYALPTIVTGLVGASSAVLTILFVKETKLPTKPSSNNKQQNQSTTLSLLQIPGIPTVLYLYGHCMLLAFGFTAILPLFFFTTPALGGFGFSPMYISLFMALVGLAQSIWLLVLFPLLHKRIGTGGIMRLCGIAYPFFMLSFPILNMMLRMNGVGVGFWISLSTVLCVGLGISMSFTAVQLALNNIAPSMQTLGTLNAMALTLVSGMRAVSPWLFTSIFAVGARTQILHGYLAWLVLLIIAAVFSISARWLPEKAAGKVYRLKGKSSEEGLGAEA